MSGVQAEAESFLRLSVLTDTLKELHTSKKAVYILFIYISLRLPNQYLKSFLYGHKLCFDIKAPLVREVDVLLFWGFFLALVLHLQN